MAVFPRWRRTLGLAFRLLTDETETVPKEEQIDAFKRTFVDRRAALGLAQVQLAREIWCPGHSPSKDWCLTLIERVERGELVPPHLWFVVRLAWVYGHRCTVSNLIEPWWKQRHGFDHRARSVSDASALFAYGQPPRYRRRNEPVTQIGYWRNRRGLSQELLAKMTYLDVKTIAGFERRDHPAPSVGQLIVLADALHLDDPAKLLLWEWLDWPSWYRPTRPDRHTKRRPWPYRAIKGRNLEEPSLRNLISPDQWQALIESGLDSDSDTADSTTRS